MSNSVTRVVDNLPKGSVIMSLCVTHAEWIVIAKKGHYKC